MNERGLVPYGVAKPARKQESALDKVKTLPTYVTRDESRAMVNATTCFQDGLLQGTVWQSRRRISEVLRLRLAEVNVADGSLELVNLKQRGKANSDKVVRVSPDLCAQFKVLAR